ncbi:hypothetical protein [Segetibacter aerophilus]|uniref:hypothetical protein n=1 Tax=Segetibacter aerophilus TaxID=670293 RepID=UPI0011BE024B|nr:hypothetical protein [Segetibacter aerophilus]
MRHFLSILAIFFTASCLTATDKTIQGNTRFDTLPLPADSATFYFKIKTNWQDTTRDALDTFVNTWYSKMLFALKEPVLKDYKAGKEVYRFTWLRTFNHPVVIRLEKQGDIVRLFSKVSDGAGGYEPGKIIFDTTVNLTSKQIDTINSRLDTAKFWLLQTEANNNNGNDGSEWIIEVYKDKHYHMAVRWTPDKGTAFRSIGEYLLSILQIKNEMTGRDQGDY